MEDIPNNILGCKKSVNNGINYQPYMLIDSLSQDLQGLLAPSKRWLFTPTHVASWLRWFPCSSCYFSATPWLADSKRCDNRFGQCYWGENWFHFVKLNHNWIPSTKISYSHIVFSFYSKMITMVQSKPSPMKPTMNPAFSYYHLVPVATATCRLRPVSPPFLLLPWHLREPKPRWICGKFNSKLTHLKFNSDFTPEKLPLAFCGWLGEVWGRKPNAKWGGQGPTKTCYK